MKYCNKIASIILSISLIASLCIISISGSAETAGTNALTENSNAWERTIEFDEYVLNGYNTWYPSSGGPYFKLVSDPDEEGDKLLHFYNHSAAGGWSPNWTITPTPTGATNTDSDAASGQVLPTSTTFKMTFRIRMNSTGGGNPQLVIFYGTTTAQGRLDANNT